jgi:flagellar basal body-associated protein FliL
MEENKKPRGITIILIYVISWLIAIAIMLCSCSPYRKIYHKPTHREIKKAMKYSTSEYYNIHPSSYYHQVSTNN